MIMSVCVSDCIVVKGQVCIESMAKFRLIDFLTLSAKNIRTSSFCNFNAFSLFRLLFFHIPVFA